MRCMSITRQFPNSSIGFSLSKHKRQSLRPGSTGSTMVHLPQNQPPHPSHTCTAGARHAGLSHLILEWVLMATARTARRSAGAMCSVAASGSTAESLHRSIEAFPGSCMVASASAGISGVCSVAGRVGVERKLILLSRFLFVCCSVAGGIKVTSRSFCKRLSASTLCSNALVCSRVAGRGEAS